MYYRKCPVCGCHLDPGERCTCEEERRREQEMIRKNLKTDKKTNQITFRTDALKRAIV